MPKDFPLDKCYRFDPNAPGEDGDETNAHLLAALGTFTEPFVPVDIRSCYDGYSWAKLPTIGKVEVKVGKELHARMALVRQADLRGRTAHHRPHERRQGLLLAGLHGQAAAAAEGNTRLGGRAHPGHAESAGPPPTFRDLVPPRRLVR